MIAALRKFFALVFADEPLGAPASDSRQWQKTMYTNPNFYRLRY